MERKKAIDLSIEIDKPMAFYCLNMFCMDFCFLLDEMNLDVLL